MKRRIAIAALATAFCFSAALAQVDVSLISAKIGTIRTLWRDDPIYSEHLWSLYPEIELGGRFFKPYLSWGASWGYWSDGIKEALPVMDGITYSEASHILGLRIAFYPQIADEHWPIPLSVFGGVSHHLIKMTYIGGGDYAGRRGQDFNDHSTTAHVGLGVSVPILDLFSLGVEAQQFIPFSSSESEQTQKNRRAFKIGLQAQF